jgi:hypothetical protein
MKPIRILSSNIDIIGEVDNYESMFFSRKFHETGDIELTINRYKKHADAFLKGNLILVGKDLNKVFLIKHREIELDEDGKATENWIIKGLALKTVVGQRITMPPSTTAYDNKQGNAETVMKHYVNNNCINPVDPRRKIEQLVLAPNLNRGETVSWQSRFKNLADELTDISLATGLGWDVTIDLKTKKWVFDVVVGKNVTVNQSSNPPVIFSPQFESLQSLHYTESEMNYKNTAYVGGQGEGVERRIIELGQDTGLNRHELFIDARDVSEKDDDDNEREEADIIKDLTDRGNQELSQLVQEHYLEGQILTYSPFEYQVDYDLGDIVTIQSKDWGVTMDTRITEVKEIYETDGFRIEGTFGNNIPTLTQKIKKSLDAPLVEKSLNSGGGEVVPATSETLGGVKVGDNLSVAEDGTLSATVGVDHTHDNRYYTEYEINILLNDKVNTVSSINSGGDLNKATRSGFYRINSGMLNAPSGVDWGQLIVCYGGQDTITQIVSDFSGINFYWRSGNPSDVGGGGTWSAWRKIWHEGNTTIDTNGFIKII